MLRSLGGLSFFAFPSAMITACADTNFVVLCHADHLLANKKRKYPNIHAWKGSVAYTAKPCDQARRYDVVHLPR
eukprot:scaffold414188_cov53-Prasinocladus_malaysianus.AAC.1